MNAACTPWASILRFSTKRHERLGRCSRACSRAGTANPLRGGVGGAGSESQRVRFSRMALTERARLMACVGAKKGAAASVADRRRYATTTRRDLLRGLVVRQLSILSGDVSLLQIDGAAMRRPTQSYRQPWLSAQTTLPWDKLVPIPYAKSHISLIRVKAFHRNAPKTSFVGHPIIGILVILSEHSSPKKTCTRPQAAACLALFTSSHAASFGLRVERGQP